MTHPVWESVANSVREIEVYLRGCYYYRLRGSPSRRGGRETFCVPDRSVETLVWWEKVFPSENRAMVAPSGRTDWGWLGNCCNRATVMGGKPSNVKKNKTNIKKHNKKPTDLPSLPIFSPKVFKCFNFNYWRNFEKPFKI